MIPDMHRSSPTPLRGGGISNRGPTARPRKRSFTEMSPPKYSSPDGPPCVKNLENINKMVGDTCDRFAQTIKEFTVVDPRILNVSNEALEAKNLPKLAPISLAVVGEQGSGKSSLINSTLGRSILRTSGSSKASTCYPTIVQWKKGASDDTQVSDIRLELHVMDRIKTLIEEQLDSYAEHVLCVHPTDDEMHNTSAAQSSGGVDSSARSIDSDVSAMYGKNAMEVFEVILDTKNDKSNAEWLEEELSKVEVLNGDLRSDCIRRAKKCLHRVMKRIGAGSHVVKFTGLTDQQWEKKRAELHKIWPFVKAVTISTGHISLRRGVRFFDLPGYSDSSQIRNTVINAYRAEADFEVVVAPILRISTNNVQERYIDDSIRMKGPNRTILVLNKMDQLVQGNEILNKIREIDQEPFLSLSTQLESTRKMSQQKNWNMDEVRRVNANIVQKARQAYIRYEKHDIEEKMRQKNVHVTAVSATSYLQAIDPLRLGEPLFNEAQSGIPSLLSHLQRLRSDENYRNYQTHFSTVLSALPKKVQAILEHHTETKSYSSTRSKIANDLAQFREEFLKHGYAQVDTLIMPLWSPSQQDKINQALQIYIHENWYHPSIRHAGVLKFLRECGVPVNRKYKGRNWNAEILAKMVKYIDSWKIDMLPCVGELEGQMAEVLNKFVQKCASRIRCTSVATKLKSRAIEALEDTVSSLNISSESFKAELTQRLEENYRRFTTEMDIKSPVATIMRPIYEHAYEARVSGSSDGHQRRLLWAITNTLQDPPAQHSSRYWVRPLEPLLPTFQGNFMEQQAELWQTACETYVEEVDVKLQDFCNTLNDLLTVESYTTREHHRARQTLKSAWRDLLASLASIKTQLDSAAPQTSRKKAKLTDSEDYPNGTDEDSEAADEILASEVENPDDEEDVDTLFVPA